MWCLAAEDTFGESCYIVTLDLTSVAFHQGLLGSTIHGFRLGDVVAKLALKEPALGSPTGRERVDSEWMFVYRLPAEAFLTTPKTSSVIRQSKFTVFKSTGCELNFTNSAELPEDTEADYMQMRMQRGERGKTTPL